MASLLDCASHRLFLEPRLGWWLHVHLAPLELNGACGDVRTLFGDVVGNLPIDVVEAMDNTATNITAHHPHSSHGVLLCKWSCRLAVACDASEHHVGNVHFGSLRAVLPATSKGAAGAEAEGYCR